MVSKKNDRLDKMIREQEATDQILKDAEKIVENWKSMDLSKKNLQLDNIIFRIHDKDEIAVCNLRRFLAEKKVCTQQDFNRILGQARRSIYPSEEKTEPTAEELENEIEELQEKCPELIGSGDVLSLASEKIKSLGLAGEERNSKIVYLALTSRILQKPVNIVVKGPSSGGKSNLVEKVSCLFPESAYYPLTAMSERALAYSEEPLQHRFLILYEAAGLSGDFGQYFLRSLVSEGRIRYETVESVNGELKSKLIEREGPTGLILTTTHTGLDPELETRLFSLTVNDTPEQTRKILLNHAKGKIIEKPDLTRWTAYQRLLELEAKNLKIEIQYAADIANGCKVKAVRLRRDFPQVLTLVKSHALLNLYHRPRGDGGCLTATLDDYAAVWELVADLVSEGVGSGVSNAVRETVLAVQGLMLDAKNCSEGIKIQQVADTLCLDKSTASRRVRSARKGGWIENLEDRKGRPARLILGDPLPEQESILPSPSSLNTKTEDTSPEITATLQPKDDSVMKSMI